MNFCKYPCFLPGCFRLERILLVATAPTSKMHLTCNKKTEITPYLLSYNMHTKREDCSVLLVVLR